MVLPAQSLPPPAAIVHVGEMDHALGRRAAIPKPQGRVLRRSNAGRGRLSYVGTELYSRTEIPCELWEFDGDIAHNAFTSSDSDLQIVRPAA